MENAATGVQIPLSTFGGLCTELSPSDLPEGGSPDNSDVAFQPGSVLTRPGLSRVYTNEPEATSVLSKQTFTALNGTRYNVKLYASGNLYVENVTNLPGTWTLVGSVPAGSYMKSVAAYGRLFMAFNDGLHGTDISRSFDGTKFNRVSQGGPCGNPAFAEYIAPTSTLGNGASSVTTTITSLASTDAQTYSGTYYAGPNGGWRTWTSTVYTTLTINVTSVVGLIVGLSVSWTGNSALNLSNMVILSIGAGSIKVGYQSSTNYSGTGGSITMNQPALFRSANVVTASTTAPHGLNPGDQISVTGVANTIIGGTISTAVRQSNVITITTGTANGVRVGSSVIIAGVTDTTFNGAWKVTAVISNVAFQVTSSNLVDSSSSGGTVSDQWNNTQRFVISVPTATSITYSEIGPDDATSNTGTITPVGQIAGGIRHAVCSFLTDYGFITPPSNPIQISTSGDKKLTLTGIPIGPSNVVGRVISFTGVDGGKYFYLLFPARDDNGNVIGTSTVINDNTSTSAIFDFSDKALLSGTGVDIDGNNLFNLKVLGNCSGVAFYADRMGYWGDENVAQNFQNMGFEGGINADGTPMGWTVSGSGLSVVNVADFGDGIRFAAGSTAKISQPAYLDYYGNTILDPNTQYSFKCWASISGGSPNVVAELYDTQSSTVLATTTIALPALPGFVQGKFSVKTPLVITSTTVLRVYVTNNGASTVTLDEFKAIFSENPYNDTKFSWSYVRNPESIDGITGILGAAADPLPIMDWAILRDNFYFVTKGPFGQLHTTKNQSTEPSSWEVNEISARCGACSMMSMVSGESWTSWASEDGARLFDASQPVKITQDIQELWDAINPLAFSAIWAVNDTENRRIYWGVPLNGSTKTNGIYHMDYRYAETASEIEDRGSVKVSAYTGKMLVLELSRKFSPWTIPATSGGFLSSATDNFVAFSDSQGRTYKLDPNKLHDDDYGTIPAYYVTSPFVSGDSEQQFQLGSFRHLYTFMGVFIYGTGNLTVTPLADSLTNVWPSRGPYLMSQDPQALLKIPLNVSGSRVFYKFSATPKTGLDAAFSLSRMIVTMMPHPMSPV